MEIVSHNGKSRIRENKRYKLKKKEFLPDGTDTLKNIYKK